MVNKAETKKIAEENRALYQVPAGSPYMLRSRNAVFISTTNSVSHEMSKALGAYMIRKYGDVKFTDRIIRCIQLLEDAVKEELKDFPKSPASFITESVPKTKIKKEKGITEEDRRIDLVRLEDNTWFEFETDHKIQKEKCITIYI